MTGRSACMEPGRAMFFDYVGRYFALPPKQRPMPEGTACSQCGRTGARLWQTNSGDAACAAQMSITAKRAGRKREGDPAPLPGDTGKFSFSRGAFAIAGPSVAKAITRLSPTATQPPGMEVRFFESDRGMIRDAVRQLLRAPPAPPFTAIVFGQSAGFDAIVTTDHSKIRINGSDPLVADRATLESLARIEGRIGARQLRDLASLRQRLAGGSSTEPQRDRDEAAYAALRESNEITPREFRSIPGPGTNDWLAYLRISGAAEPGTASIGE